MFDDHRLLSSRAGVISLWSQANGLQEVRRPPNGANAELPSVVLPVSSLTEFGLHATLCDARSNGKFSRRRLGRSANSLRRNCAIIGKELSQARFATGISGELWQDPLQGIFGNIHGGDDGC